MMKAILLDIGSQLRLCAALMSEAELLRDQPHVVASQFKVAASRIEQLKAFLEKPAKAVSADKPWFDKTVLEGVYKLVDVTLRRHLKPLMQGYKFPIIFQQELKQWNAEAREDLLIKEIKETNCVGAMVVLYYLLYWHLALILLNRRHHPACYADVVQGDDEDDGFDFEALLLSKLPKSHDLLEYRRFGTGLVHGLSAQKPEAEVFKSEVFKASLFDRSVIKDRTTLPLRHTLAVDVLRQVLVDDFTFKESGREVEQSTARISQKIHSLLWTSIASKLDLFSGVISTFDLQDDVEKWEDMYRLFHVQSNAEAEGAGFAQYAYRLVHVLKSRPYSASDDSFIDIASRAAVNDYGSVALMTDISKSFIALARLVKALLSSESDTEDVNSAIGVLMVQMYERNDKRVRDELNGHAVASKDETVYHSSKFIQHTPSWRRNVSSVSGVLNVQGGGDSVVIDDIAGYYWGARPCDLDQFNHQYLACPSLEIDPRTGAKMLNRLQALGVTEKGSMHRNAFAMYYLTTLHRNSLFVLSVSKSLTKVAEILRPFIGGTKITVNTGAVLKPDPMADAAWIETLMPAEFHDSIPKPPPVDAKKPAPQLPFTINELQKRLNRETAALKYCIEQAKSPEFQKYPGISWPVVYGDRESNVRVFDRVHAIPKVTPSVTESTAGLHDVLKEMMEHSKMREVIERAALLSQKDGGGGGGGRRGGDGVRPGSAPPPAAP